MKPFVITTLCVFCTLFTFAQTFEGKVVYQNTYKSRTPSISDKQYTTMMGSTNSYYIKGANYKSETNGSFILWQIYISKQKKLYNKINHSPNILWEDVTVNKDQIDRTTLNKDVVTILGYKCNELIMHSVNGTVQKYYFSAKLPVDPKLYTSHLYGNWYAYLAKAKAVPLKMIISNANFTLTSIATEVKAITLNDNLFTLPPDSKTEKSMY